ncbi:MAG: PKD domain-containing protein [Prevotellaceae bacterium]|jgi:PKD repeat protein|nr:PKD domain-containing protein [Prevotellaceae bacterium]
MKSTTYLMALACGAIMLTSCEKDADDNNADEGKTPTAITADFEFTIGASNLVTFTNKSTGHSASSWNFGDGGAAVTDNNTTVTHTYPTNGTYHVTLTVTASDGSTASKQKDVVIENDDVSGLLTATVQKLIGGNAIDKSQTWVFDRWNQYVAEVAAKTGKTIGGHIGLGELGSYASAWWGAGKDEKTAAGWHIYEETFKFSLESSGLKLDITNPGRRGYGRLKNNISGSKFPDATEWLDPNNSNAPSDAEAEFEYTDGTYSYSVTEPATADGYAKLTLTDKAFLGYYVGTQEYDILYLTDSVLAVRAADLNDGDDNFDWVFVFIRQDLCPAEDPDPAPGPVGGANNSDDFEGAETIILPDATTTGSEVVENPSKTGINTSNKVYKFEKTGDYYSNVYYLSTEKFDLTTKNKVKVKVYIPSTNDYDTEGTLAGDWLTIKKLQKQLVIKLQDNSKGTNSWDGQTEVTQNGLATNTWLELTFDFSDVAARTDYDKLVIQFGQEGHSRPGTFYFDDLQFFTE